MSANTMQEVAQLVDELDTTYGLELTDIEHSLMVLAATAFHKREVFREDPESLMSEDSRKLVFAMAKHVQDLQEMIQEAV